MNPKIDVMTHGYNIWLVAILRPDFILRDQDRKWEIHHWTIKYTKFSSWSLLEYPGDMYRAGHLGEQIMWLCPSLD